jgi:hypothetical protein
MRWKRHDGVMNASAPRVQRVFFVLLLLHTLVAALIWGINTFFLLDAGLTNTRAFAANAFFTGGLVLFEDLERDELAYVHSVMALGVRVLVLHSAHSSEKLPDNAPPR